MDTPNPDVSSPDETVACTQCGNKPILKEYPNALCADCRERFIKFPIPKWVSGVGIAVLLLVILGLITFPNQISTDVHLKRAEIAADHKKYMTAEKELRKVLESAPALTDAKARLMIAAFYNNDLATFNKMGFELQGATLQNSNLSTLNEMVKEFADYYPSDSLNLLASRYLPPARIPQDSFKMYVTMHPEEPYAFLRYVDNYCNQEDLHWCDSLIRNILYVHSDYVPGMMTAVYVNRMEGKYESALKYIDDILAINKESVFAISAKARILMAQHKVIEGIDLAKKACELSPEDGYAQTTLALGYHLNHQTAERDKLILRASKDSTLAGYMDYIKDIVSGKETFK